MARRRQGMADMPGNLLIVFYQQDFHRTPWAMIFLPVRALCNASRQPGFEVDFSYKERHPIVKGPSPHRQNPVSSGF
jgi:hypothetical protein